MKEKTAEPGANCPVCGSPGKSVKVKTIKHWIVTGLVQSIPDIPFYFCEKKDCPIVYFSEDGPVRYTTKEVRSPVGIKETSGPITLCYCFGFTDEMIRTQVLKTGRSSVSTLIARETGLGNCACDIRNPSGRCCLKDVKTVEARAGNTNLAVQGGG